MTPEDRMLYPALPAPLKNGETVHIRPLTPDDGEALAACYTQVPHEHIRFYCPYPLDRAQALANAAKADSPTEVVLVAEANGKVIGGYAWYRWSPPDAERSNFGICLQPAYQNLGLGRALLTRLLEIARHLGPPIMSLTVQHANVRAVKLYTSMGFVPLREQTRHHDPARGFAEEPEYYMELRVR